MLVVVASLLATLSPRVDACLQQAKVDAEAAVACLDAVAADDDADAAERDDAAEAKRVVVRLLPHLQPAAPVVVVDDDHAVRRFVTGGQLEAVVSGASFGAVAGFVGTAGVLSATRTSEKDALPLLLAAPAVGLVGGGVASYFAVEASGASADDVALVSSTAWAGMVMGLTLQLAVFADSRDVQAAPLRFFTTLGGGALGLAAGVGWAPFLDISAGDVSLANSALGWGAVLTLIGIASLQPQGLDLATGTMIVGGGALLPFITVLALHPLFELHRVSTWAVDVGGVVGLVGGAAIGGAAALVVGGRAFGPVVGASVLAGLALGVGTAVAVDGVARAAFDDAPPPLSLRPNFLPAKDGIAPGVVVEVAAW